MSESQPTRNDVPTKHTVVRHWTTCEDGIHLVEPAPEKYRERAKWVRYEDFVIVADRFEAAELENRRLREALENPESENVVLKFELKQSRYRALQDAARIVRSKKTGHWHNDKAREEAAEALDELAAAALRGE